MPAPAFRSFLASTPLATPKFVQRSKAKHNVEQPPHICSAHKLNASEGTGRETRRKLAVANAMVPWTRKHSRGSFSCRIWAFEKGQSINSCARHHQLRSGVVSFLLQSAAPFEIRIPNTRILVGRVLCEGELYSETPAEGRPEQPSQSKTL